MRISVRGKVLVSTVAVGLAVVLAFVIVKVTEGPRRFQGSFGNYISWDSGLYPSSPPLWPRWLDDDTVVFMGNMSAKPRNYAQASQLESAMIIWRLGKPPAAYDDDRWKAMGNRRFFCAAYGKLVYPIGFHNSDDGRQGLVVAEGTPGQISQRILEGIYNKTFEEKIYADEGDPDSESFCDFYQDERMAGHHWAVSDDHEHYIDLGMKNSPSKTSLLLISARAKSPPVLLPITLGEILRECIQFHRFSGIFYLYDCVRDRAIGWSKEKPCFPYWTVDPRK
jgi:hypothetical protein